MNSVIEFLFNKFEAYELYPLPCVFPKFLKIPEITSPVEFFLAEAYTNRFVQNSSSKQLFPKLSEKLENELEKHSNMDVFQKFSEQLFLFRNANGRVLLKIQPFLNTNERSEWMNGK